MGSRGPVPKHSSQRRRRNETGVESVVVGGGVEPPELLGEHSEVAVRFWDALGRSGQSVFFQPSDWSQAELVVLAIDQFVSKPSAMMLQSINSMMSNLLVTEGDRRRLRLELQDAPADDGEESQIADLNEFRSRFAG